MYLEQNYKVESVTRTKDSAVFKARKHVNSGVKGKRIRDISVPDGIELNPGDVVRLTVENHTPDRGWVLDKFIGFPFDKERAGWDPLDGVGD